MQIENKNTSDLSAKWIIRHNGSFWWWACSNCDEEVTYDKYGNVCLSNYCGHCGLKMTIDTTGLEDVCE